MKCSNMKKYFPVEAYTRSLGKTRIDANPFKGASPK